MTCYNISQTCNIPCFNLVHSSENNDLPVKVDGMGPLCLRWNGNEIHQFYPTYIYMYIIGGIW